MKYRPILFSGPMVRALLDGRKTQTRRVVKPQPRRVDGGVPFGDAPASAHAEPGSMMMRCPYGKRGDRLWVREAWAESDMADGTPVIAYRAGGCIAIGKNDPHGPDYLIRAYTFNEDVHAEAWRPSIHMPRSASRITLEVTGVRVERLQDISEADAIAEGIQELIDAGVDHDGTPRDTFRKLWESINGPGSWESDTWVWVVEFRRVEGGAA